MTMRSAGFTLIELLVVIAIIAILAAVLLPVFARAKDSADTSTCISNMHQIFQATMMYVGDNGGYFPVMAGNWTWPDATYRNLYRKFYMDRVLGPYASDKDIFICPMWRRNEFRYDPPAGPLMFSPWWPWPDVPNFAFGKPEAPRVRSPDTLIEPAKYNLYCCGSINNHARLHDRQLQGTNMRGTVVCKGDGSAMLAFYHQDFEGCFYWHGGYRGWITPTEYDNAYVDGPAYGG
jgi:prepilin-type N-terminal cleavage/methylation domain-containing protein